MFLLVFALAWRPFSSQQTELYKIEHINFVLYSQGHLNPLIIPILIFLMLFLLFFLFLSVLWQIALRYPHAAVSAIFLLCISI